MDDHNEQIFDDHEEIEDVLDEDEDDEMTADKGIYSDDDYEPDMPDDYEEEEFE